jgi:(p)ppGpp synthase/HD superfamily hydrolase
MFSTVHYVETLRFAAAKHEGQKEPGENLPYVVHVASVAAELIAALPQAGLANPDLAVACALLHDTVEDTSTTLSEIEQRFGPAIAAGVSALTKNASLPKPEQMPDSLRRIREQPPEIAAVKLADRITNLAAPPKHWTKEKCGKYRIEAIAIADALGSSCPALDARLRARIEEYVQYC